MNGRNPHNVRRWLGLTVVLLAVPMLPFLIVGELPGERWLQARGARDLTFGLSGVLLLALDILLPIPSSVVGTLLGGRLGVAGFFFTALGLWLGHGIGYLIGRLWPARWVPEVHTAPTAMLVFLTRPVPVLAEAAAIGAGATRMPITVFLFTCLAGDALYAAALTAAGAQFLPNDQLVLALIFPMSLSAVAWAAWKAIGRRKMTSRSAQQP